MEELPIKHKSEGVKHCCYGTCNSDIRYRHREDMKGVYFIPFPKPITKKEKCERWIKACGRPAEDFNVQKIKRCTYICSKHFIIGGHGPTIDHPDPIPALLHTDEQVKRFQRKRKAPVTRGPPVKISKKDESIVAESLIELSNSNTRNASSITEADAATSTCTSITEENIMAHLEKSTQTESTPVENREVQTIYDKDYLNAKIENMLLKNEMKLVEEKHELSNDTKSTPPLNLSSIKDDDAKMKLFTGIYYDQFMALYEFLGDSVHNLKYWDGNNTKENVKRGIRKLEHKEELFLTLVRLRRGYSVDTMAHFFGLAASTVSTIFTTWIQLLYCHFNDYRQHMFPERQHFKDNLPRVFKTFRNIRCTIDCTEFFVQMPRDFGRQGNLYSSYKSTHTFKCLIGVAPNGAIVYVSDLFEGSISDRAIVEKSGFLNYMNPGDLVLADRGFTIKDLLPSKRADLNIPPFLGKRENFTPQEELTTRRIAKARIHVERVIERVKKFKLISGVIPLSLSPIANQLVFVACCLVNFQEPLVK